MRCRLGRNHRIAKLFRSDSRPGDTQTVEWDVPHQLLPMRLREIGSHFANNASIAEHAGDIMGARLGPSLELTHYDHAVIQVMDNPGRDSIQANEAKPTHDLLRGNKRRQ